MRIPDRALSGPTDTRKGWVFLQTLLHDTKRTADITICIVLRAVLYTAPFPTLNGAADEDHSLMMPC